MELFSRRITSRQTRKESEQDFAGDLVTVSNPSSDASEAYRTLRTSLLYAFVDEPLRIVLVTSPGRREGKSTTCANLGVVLAQAAKSTLILDCNFREPAIHKLFELPNVRGIRDVLVGECSLQEVYQEPVKDLKVVSAGYTPPDPVGVLSTQRFSELLADARREFDYVLMDSPAVGLVSDPLILATKADGVLLVLDAQHTRKTYIRESVHKLEAVGATVLGTVVNNVEVSG